MPPKSHETRFATLVEELSREAGVTPPSDEPGADGKFGSAALKVDGKIFAMLVRGELVVKLPRRQVNALVASGDGRPFDTGRGRIMKEWVSLDPGSRLSWPALAREALQFVGGRAV